MSHYSVFAVSEGVPTSESYAPDEDDVHEKLEHFDWVSKIDKDLLNIRGNLESCLSEYENVKFELCDSDSGGAPSYVKVTIGKGSIRKALRKRLAVWKERCAAVTEYEFAFRSGDAFYAYSMLSRTTGKPYVVDTTEEYDDYDPMDMWLFNRVEGNDSGDTVFYVYAEYDAHY